MSERLKQAIQLLDSIKQAELPVHKARLFLREVQLEIELEKIQTRLDELNLFPKAIAPYFAHGFAFQHIENGNCPLCYRLRRIDDLKDILQKK